MDSEISCNCNRDWNGLPVTYLELEDDGELRLEIDLFDLSADSMALDEHLDSGGDVGIHIEHADRPEHTGEISLPIPTPSGEQSCTAVAAQESGDECTLIPSLRRCVQQMKASGGKGCGLDPRHGQI